MLQYHKENSELQVQYLRQKQAAHTDLGQLFHYVYSSDVLVERSKNVMGSTKKAKIICL